MSPVRPPPAELAFPDALLPQFRPEALVGSGGFGFVWRCEQRQLARTVAVKLVHPHVARETRFQETFAREARMMARVAHPAIIPILDHGLVADVAYIVMPYLPGPCLAKHMGGRVLPWPEAVRYAHQIAQGLAALHAAGVVHRDLKPSNVLLDETGDARVSDFGQSKLVGSRTHSQPGSLIGTPGYIAPERLGPTQDLPQSDLYALGVILWAMLTGRRPYEPAPVPGLAGHIPQIQEMLAPTLQPLPPFPTGVQPVPVTLVELTRRLLSMKPEERGRDANQIVHELEKFLEPPGPAAKAAPARRYGRWALLGATLVLIGSWWTSRPPPRVTLALPSPRPSKSVAHRRALSVGVVREFALRLARKNPLPLQRCASRKNLECPLVITRASQLGDIALELNPGLRLVGVNGLPGKQLRLGMNWVQLEGITTQATCGSATVRPPFLAGDIQPMPPSMEAGVRDRIVMQTQMLMGLVTDTGQAEHMVATEIPASRPQLRRVVLAAITTHQRATLARGLELNMITGQLWSDPDVLSGGRETISAANALLDQEPGSWEAWHDIGWALYHMGHFHMANLALCRALMTWPDSHWDWWELALAAAIQSKDESLTARERSDHRQESLACLERVRRLMAERTDLGLFTALQAAVDGLYHSLHLR